MKHRLLITDVTSYGTKFCIAGWDIDREMMVRPEPPSAKALVEDSRFWDGDYVGVDKVFSVGNVVEVDTISAPADFPYPHATEDKLVVAKSNITVLQKLSPNETIAATTKSYSLSFGDAFDHGCVRAASGKAYVAAGHKGRSLGAIQIDPKAINFFENSFENKPKKLRAMVAVGNMSYDLPITAERARATWLQGGISELAKAKKNAKSAHLRIGLSRPFPAMPNQCYVQINGVIFV